MFLIYLLGGTGFYFGMFLDATHQYIKGVWIFWETGLCGSTFNFFIFDYCNSLYICFYRLGGINLKPRSSKPSGFSIFSKIWWWQRTDSLYQFPN